MTHEEKKFKQKWNKFIEDESGKYIIRDMYIIKAKEKKFFLIRTPDRFLEFDIGMNPEIFKEIEAVLEKHKFVKDHT